MDLTDLDRYDSDLQEVNVYIVRNSVNKDKFWALSEKLYKFDFET